MDRTDASLSLSSASIENLGTSYAELQNAMHEAIKMEDFESAETYQQALNNLKNDSLSNTRQNLLETHTNELDRMEKAYNSGKDKFNAIWSDRHKKLSKLAEAKRSALSKRCALELEEFDTLFYSGGLSDSHKLHPQILAYIFVNENNIRYSTSIASEIVNGEKKESEGSEKNRDIDVENTNADGEHKETVAEKICKIAPTLPRFKPSTQLLATRKKMSGCITIRDFKTAQVIRDEVHKLEDVEYHEHIDNVLTIVGKLRAQLIAKSEKMSMVLEKRIESAERDLINKWESDLQKLRLHFQTVRTQENFRYLASKNPKPRSYSNSNGSRPTSRCSSRQGISSRSGSKLNSSTSKNDAKSRSMVKSQAYTEVASDQNNAGLVLENREKLTLNEL